MYNDFPSFILGFHGCDRSVAEAVFAGKSSLRPSQNAYDWLGHGAYFWESNPRRALDYAHALRTRPRKQGAKIRNPAVVGAVIDLGLCLNLLDQNMTELVRKTHRRFIDAVLAAKAEPPRNEGGKDLLRRVLDCAVLEHLHTEREEAGSPPFDTVRGVFIEGEPIYPTAGFHEKSHIQVCVRNLRCVKGYFRVLPDVVNAG